MSRTRFRSLRIAAPIALAGAIGLGTWLPSVTASATPDLPTLTAQQLLTRVAQSHVAGLSGKVRLTASLGLPDLSGLTDGTPADGSTSAFDPTTLLSGTHDISVWDSGATEQRLALPSSLSEVDVVRNGDQAWVSDSSTQKVTHYVLAAHPAVAGHEAADSPDGTADVTPDQAAKDLLARITPGATVTVQTPTRVAGHDAYTLEVVPHATDSTIARVTVSVDSATGLPLQLAVYAAGQSSPALQLGYTSVSFSTPSAGNFAAPHGTSEVTRTIGGHPFAGGFHGTPGQWHGKPGSAAGAPAQFHGAPAKFHGAPGQWHRGPAGFHGGPGQLAQAAAGHVSASGQPWAEIVTIHTHLSPNDPQVTQLTTAVSGSFGSGRLLHTALRQRAAAAERHDRGRPGHSGRSRGGRRWPSCRLVPASSLFRRTAPGGPSWPSPPQAWPSTFGSITAVDGVDLAVPRGSVFGFLGPNGSGKTTTIRMLLGLIAPSQGTWELLGEQMPDRAEAALPRVGALVEGPAFYPWLSGRDNLARFDAAGPDGRRRTRKDRIAAALDRVGLVAAADRRYKGYSLGMRQRLGLAGALLRPRDLLVLDEPTNGMDPQGTREIRGLIRELAAEGVHRLPVQPPAGRDRAGVLARGRDDPGQAGGPGHARRSAVRQRPAPRRGHRRPGPLGHPAGRPRAGRRGRGRRHDERCARRPPSRGLLP